MTGGKPAPADHPFVIRFDDWLLEPLLIPDSTGIPLLNEGFLRESLAEWSAQFDEHLDGGRSEMICEQTAAWLADCWSAIQAGQRFPRAVLAVDGQLCYDLNARVWVPVAEFFPESA